MGRKLAVLTFALAAITSQSALAQGDIGLKNAGFVVGVVDPEALNSTFGIGAFADVGGFTPRVRLEPRIDYWSQSEDYSGSSVSVRDITFGARVKYYFPVTGTRVRPYGGGGLGLHFLRAEVGVLDPFSGGTMTFDDTSTKLGLDLGGGVLTPLTPRANLVVEAWYGMVSDFNQISLRVGFSHAL
jgi:opacity protein-like surface antigen